MNFRDLQIIEGIGTYGPRNMTEVARKLGVPEATLRRRVKKLGPHLFLRANVYHTNIGLKKVIVFAKAFQGHESLLYRCLDAHDYVIYIARSFGACEGCVAILAVPTERCAEFERFLEFLESEGIAREIQYHWSTCFQTVNLKCDWYNEDANHWDFFWEDWIQEIDVQTTELPFTLKDPPDYPQKADATDIFILKELEIDATTSFKAIAQKLNTSVPLVKYHYDRHVVDLCLLEDFQVVFYPFDKSRSNGFFFMFMFDTLEKMAKFARSLMNKPFALSLGKIFGEPALFAYIYLPMSEFRKFVDSLGQLIRTRFLRRYEYLLQDGAMTQRYTIPYKRFRDQSWVYDQKKYIEKVRVLLEADSARPADGLRETQALLPWQPQETSHVSTEVVNLERS
jgi:hypothetical protein